MEQLENIMNLNPNILFFGLILLIICAVSITCCLPFFHRHVEQLKIGNNEIKFRSFPSQNFAGFQDVIDEIQSWKDTDITDKETLHSAMDKFSNALYMWRWDLFHSASHLSLLITAMERPDVRTGLGTNKEEIMQSLYERLDHEIGQYFFLETAAIKFAKCVDKDEILRQKIKDNKYTDSIILEFHESIPDKYKKFDYQKFIKEQT